MRNKTFFIVVLAAMLLVTACADTAIDRHALVMRTLMLQKLILFIL